MSRVRKRLEQYKAELERQTQYKAGLPGSALDIINTLLNDLKQDENKNGWIPVSERLPESDKYVLVSFKNFSIPMVGKYTVDDDGGTFRIGDEDEDFAEYGLYVNAWMKLPKRYVEECEEYETD